MARPLSSYESDNEVAKFIEKRINELTTISGGEISQADIARQAGFSKPNIINMLKKGATKVPPSRVMALAKALGADPAYFLELVLKDQDRYSGIMDALKEIYGENILRSPTLSQDAEAIYSELKALSNGKALKFDPTHPATAAALKNLVNSMAQVAQDEAEES
ncbi:helix-turn-helix domain-containing protein [Chitinibacter tainanensis]|uniref:helix-turn-helix domain-containing protein n=1 Tax=Chitinibacter tainanensis TaxID=230667 RepID=UPI00068513E2|nr:helix-turn-helix transcriptional regulator [Chitinibacter tainanensis]